MKKRCISLLLVAAMLCGNGFVDNLTVRAEEPAGIVMEDAASTESTEETVGAVDSTEQLEPTEQTELTEETEQEESTERVEPTEIVEMTEEVPAEAAEAMGAAPAWVAKPYDRQSAVELQKSGALVLSEGMTAAMEANEKAGGLLISGEAGQYASGRFFLTSGFNFTGNAVGRVQIDALAPKGVDISVAVYLDDDTEPMVTIPMEKQKKSGKWTYDGAKTVDVLEKNIVGQHKVSFQIVTAYTKKFTFLLRSIEFAESSLPVVYLNIDETQGAIAAMNADPEHETECYGSMTLQVPDGYRSEYAPDQKFSTQTYELEYIRGRGNSTWGCDKKPYKLKLEKKADLLGMGKNKHWVLLANRYDPSMLRNKATYWLGKELGMPYTPECVFVDVVMNGVYYGSYYLSEQVRVGSSRVDIDDLEDNEESKNAVDLPFITGGYLLSMFPYDDDKETKLFFTTDHNNEFLIESPSFEDYKNDAQYNYIKNYVQKTEDAIYGEDFRNADGTHYSDLMDVSAAIDYYWIQEISMNGDAFVSTSTYLYKPRNEKLYWGPLWDFDYVAWGDTDYSTEPVVEGFETGGRCWFERLLEDRTFAQKVVERWPYIKGKLLELCKDGGQIDRYYNNLIISQKYDVEKWGMTNAHVGYEDEETVKNFTFPQEVNRLKSWVQKRVAWIDENLDVLLPKEHTVTYVVNGKTYATQKAYENSVIIEFPKNPVKKGYVFKGWYRKIDGEEIRYQGEIYVSEDMKLYARWVKKSKVVPVEKLYVLNKRINVPFSDQYYGICWDVMPLNATITDVKWTSSNESIATVDIYGCVNFVQPGKVRITGTCNNGVKASVLLNIVDDDNIVYPDPFITLNRTNLKLRSGKWAKLTPSFSPAESCVGTLYWQSSNPEVAYVTDTGVVIADQEGTATILVYSTLAGAIASCNVTVDNPVVKGNVYTISGLQYKVKKTGKDGTVACIGREKKSLKKVKIPASVRIKGKTYKVTAVTKNAFKDTNITQVTLGSNIKVIGENAFYGCKKLSTITIKTKKISKIGKGAWKKIAKKAQFKVPAGKQQDYKKLLSSATGYRKKTMKIKQN